MISLQLPPFLFDLEQSSHVTFKQLIAFDDWIIIFFLIITKGMTLFDSETARSWTEYRVLFEFNLLQTSRKCDSF
jgi:hypothetical protein